MHYLQKHFAIIFFNVFEKYLVSFVSISFSVQKKTPQKNLDSLYFMFTLFVVTLLILHAFLLFSFFSYHVSSPCGLLSLCLFTLSLSSDSSFFFQFFFKKNSFFHLIIAFCEAVFVLSPLLFRFFCCCSFQSCSFEQDKLTPFFSRKPLI